MQKHWLRLCLLVLLALASMASAQQYPPSLDGVKTYGCAIQPVTDALGKLNGVEAIVSVVYQDPHNLTWHNRARLFRPEDKGKARKFCFKWIEKMDKLDQKKGKRK